MSCCAPPLPLDGAPDPSAARQEIRLASRDLGNGLRQSDLSVPGLHCAACIRAVETGLARLPGVAQVRVNLSTRRVAVQWRGEEAPELLTALAGLGYSGHLFESEADDKDPERDRLMRALAVAGWAASFADCARCGSPGPHTAFAAGAGGAVCTTCRPPGSASPAPQTVTLLAALQSGDWAVAEASETRHRREASGLVAAYSQFHLERGLRSLRLVERG